MDLWISQHIFYFLLRSGLDRGLLSDSIRGDVYTTECTTHAYYLLNACSESFASRRQLKNVLKTNYLNVSYWSRTQVLRASVAVKVKPRTYLCSLYNFSLYFILIYFHFYLPIPLLFRLTMTPDVLLYLFILCESSI